MKKYILSLLIGTALLSSCLDVDIVDRVEKEDGFFKTEDHALAAINGVYSTLYAFLIIKQTGLSYFRPMKTLCSLPEMLYLPLFPTIHTVLVPLQLLIFGESYIMALKTLMK
jgi:hypothetical protein